MKDNPEAAKEIREKVLAKKFPPEKPAGEKAAKRRGQAQKSRKGKDPRQGKIKRSRV